MLHLATKAFAPGRVPVPGAARRHRPQLPRGARLPRRDRRAPRHPARSRPRAGLHRRRTPAGALRRHPQPAADAAAARRDRGRPPRRRLRRRPPRRGQGARQGADHLAARRVRAVGPAQPAPRAVEPVQRPPHARPARARLPDLELDRARRLALHRARGASRCRRCTSPTSARCMPRDGMWRAGRRVLAAARRRDRRASASSATARSAT